MRTFRRALHGARLVSPLSSDERGQAVTEYVLMLAVVAGFYMMVFRFLSTQPAPGLGSAIAGAVSTPYQSLYTYGYPGAKGLDNGPPDYHPRAPSSFGGKNSFRIFINPDVASGG